VQRPHLVGPDHFGVVLALLLSMFVLGPLLEEVDGADAVLGILSAGVLVATLVACGARPRVVQVVGGIALAAAVVTASGSLAAGNEAPVWVSAIVAALLVTTPFLVLRRVLHHSRVTLATVAGGLCAYLLVGFAFASIYRTINLVDDTAFTPELKSASTYFSFVTLTTTGFGDYVATSDITRSLVMLEAIIGQVLLVTLVARFVSTLGQERGEPPRHVPLPPRD
jgi:Ion channel